MSRTFLLLALFSSMLIAKAETEIKDAYQEFAFQLFEELERSQEQSGNLPDNLVISPLSVQYALGILMNGSKGETQQEIIAALHLDGHTQEEINRYNWELPDKLKSSMSQHFLSLCKYEGVDANWETVPQVEMANGLWADAGIRLKRKYCKSLKQYYNANCSVENLSKQSTMDKIDKWVCENTHGQITSINQEPSDELMLMLVNTLYFKGGWEIPFEEQETKEEPFYSWGRESSNLVSMMHRHCSSVEYAETDSIQAVKLYYGYDQKFSMSLFVANGSSSRPLTYQIWKTLQKEMTNREVKLSMPRFSVCSDFSLSDILRKIGINHAFTRDQADLSSLSANKIFVNGIKQLGTISVDETGTTASAATVLQADGDSWIHNIFVVNLNKPFYFTIEDNQTGTILFVGHINHL